MVELIDSIVWPIVTLILVFSFKSPIEKLIGRIREVGKGGIKIGEELSQSVSNETDTKATELIRAFDSNYMRQMESRIYDDLKAKGITDKTPATDILVQHLASTQLQLSFEKIHQVILGTQINLLNFLNSSTVPVDKNSLQNFYNTGYAQYPEGFKNYSFDNYLSYLQDSGLTYISSAGYQISEFGREYLTYIAKVGKTGFKPY